MRFFVLNMSLNFLMVLHAAQADSVYVTMTEELSWSPESAVVLYSCGRDEAAVLFPIMRKEQEGSISTSWRVAAVVEIPPTCESLNVRVLYKNRRKVHVSSQRRFSRKDTPEAFVDTVGLGDLLTKQKNHLLEQEKENSLLVAELEKKKQLADSLGGLREILEIRERVAILTMHLSRLERVQIIIESAIERAKVSPRPVQYEVRMSEGAKALESILKTIVNKRT